MPTLEPEQEESYAELCCVSNFSFRRGASDPEELFARAARLGYSALAMTDECSLAGAVRALQASERHRVPLILGSRFTLTEGPTLVALVRDQCSYTQLCRLITRGRRQADKGQYRLSRNDLDELSFDHCWLLALIDYEQDVSAEWHDLLGWLAIRYPRQTRLAWARHRGPHDIFHVERLKRLRSQYGFPWVAVGDVHMHSRSRRALQDIFTALRLNTSVPKAGRALAANGERYLRPRAILARLYPVEARAETLRLARACTFNLRDIHYDYPAELVPKGHTSSSYLRELV